MEKKKTLTGILVSAVVLTAALFGDALLPTGGLPLRVAGIALRLSAMFAGLFLAFKVFALVFQRADPKSGHGRTLFTLTNSAVRYILVLVGLMWALSICGVDVRALLAGAGVVALIIGFGAESLIADVITGVFMLFEHQYEVGDIIVVGDFRGTVTQIGIRTTSITDTGGNVKIINNSDIRSLINRSNDLSFVSCDIGIPYLGYLRKAEAVISQTLPTLTKEYPDLFERAPRYLGVEQIDVANDAVFLRVAAEVSEQNIYAARRALNRTLLMALEEAGIPKPVAQLDLKQRG